MLRILRPGRWTREQISVAWVPSTRRIIPEVETAIQSAWDTALARPGVHLFDGPMCRVESWTATDDRLRITLSKTSYKPFLGTNMANPKFADDFGPEVMANPLGVSTLIQTGDQRLLLGERTAALAYHPGRVHPFAGCMEPADADPFDTARRELNEELSLTTQETPELFCIGLIEPQDLRQPELVFLAATPLNQSDIQARLDPVEHHAIWSIAAEERAVEQALREERRFTPVAAGALMLWGRLNVGEAWFESVRSFFTNST